VLKNGYLAVYQQKIISDSRSVENMPDNTLRSEVQPAQANDQGHWRVMEYNGNFAPLSLHKGCNGSIGAFS